MSDVMLHGVLRMPPDLWTDEAIDKAQRHGRYLEASDRIIELERERNEAREERDIAKLEFEEISNDLSDARNRIWQLENIIEGLNNFANERFDEIQKVRKELDEAMEKVEQQRKEIARLNGATNHAGGTPLKIALRERDEAIANRDIARLAAQDSDKAHDRMVEELENVYKERDEAREALEEEKKFHYRTHAELIQTQCRFMDVTQAIIATLEENRYLADGDDCTLAKLKSAVPEWK